MYSASADFLTKIKSKIRKITWSGTITTVGGSTYDFDDDPETLKGKIISGSITRSISSQSLAIGTAYASTFSMEIVLPGVSRYELYDGIVEIFCSIDGASDVIPMGIYTISEASQTLDHINIKAYDYMVDFDAVNFSASQNTVIQSPYDWLIEFCSVCGVTLGNTLAEIEAMPNGIRNTGFADAVASVSTYRDALSFIAAYLGGFAYIGRDGALYIGQYGSTANDTIAANFRFASELSDFKTTYDGLYATYKDGGVQEYVDNTNSGGIVLDLGTNPFLQINNQTNRLAALQEIIDAWDSIYYVPFSVEMPLVPIYDPGDVLKFTGNQASTYDLGAITEITYNIGGSMSVKCSGDNPILYGSQDRFSKTLGGLEKEYSNGQETGDKPFWLLSTTNTSVLTVGSSEVQIAEIEYNQKTYGQNVEMILTIDAQISATATVNIRVVVDDDASLEMSVTEEKSLSGERTFHCSNPQLIYGEGIHACKVYMTVTDNPVLVGDLY